MVLKIDKENEKFSLGIKQLHPNPWDDISQKYPPGTEIEGSVTGVTDFGAFVRLEEGIEGLVYSSEIAQERVENPADHVREGESVRAIVIRVDPAEQKISLSMKAVHDQAEREALKQQAAQQATSQKATLGDLLAEKLAQKESEQSSEE